MDPLLTTLVLIGIALVGARFSFSSEAIPLGPRLIFRTGTHFFLLGVLLGPEVLDFLTVDALERLFPLLALGLGWIGFLFGLQLDRKTLREFPVSFHVLGLGQAIGTLVLFTAAAAMLFLAFGILDSTTFVVIAIVGAAACISTPAGIAMVSANFHVRGNVARLLFFIGSVDAVVGIVALQVLYVARLPPDHFPGIEGFGVGGWLFLATGLGIVCGILFLWLTRTSEDRDEFVLFLMGMSALSSGAALRMGLSPLFVSMVMGLIVANGAKDRRRVSRALAQWEKPIYVLLLILAGALVRLPSLWVIPFVGAYVLLRGASKVASTAAIGRILPVDFPLPKRLGLALVPQGGMSVAMAASAMLTLWGLELHSLDVAAMVFSTVVLGVIASDLVGPILTTSVLRRAGELSPEVEEALADGDSDQALSAALRHIPEPMSDSESP